MSNYGPYFDSMLVTAVHSVLIQGNKKFFKDKFIGIGIYWLFIIYAVGETFPKLLIFTETINH